MAVVPPGPPNVLQPVLPYPADAAVDVAVFGSVFVHAAGDAYKVIPQVPPLLVGHVCCSFQCVGAGSVPCDVNTLSHNTDIVNTVIALFSSFFAGAA